MANEDIPGHLLAQMSPQDIQIFRGVMAQQGGGGGPPQGGGRDAIAMAMMAQQPQVGATGGWGMGNPANETPPPQGPRGGAYGQGVDPYYASSMRQPSYGGGGGLPAGMSASDWATFSGIVGADAANAWRAQQQQNLGSGPGGGGEGMGGGNFGGAPSGGPSPGPFGGGNTAVGQNGISANEANQAANAPNAQAPGWGANAVGFADYGGITGPSSIAGGYGPSISGTGMAATQGQPSAGSPFSGGWGGFGLGATGMPGTVGYGNTTSVVGSMQDAINAAQMQGFMNANNMMGYDAGGNGTGGGVSGAGAGLGGDGSGGYGFGIGPGPGGENSVGPDGGASPY